jgi:two-component system NtrC family sensor kinase
MMEVFVNLFVNAGEAMPTGGRLTIRTASQEAAVEVQVEVTGDGIPPEHIERIFDPFFTTRASGTGLGLAVVARVLEQHRSEILVESTVGVGTRFIIRLSATGEGREVEESSRASSAGR